MEEKDEPAEVDKFAHIESWVRIQQHTFTNWINDKLRVHVMAVEDLTSDFGDGIKLCKLIETLRGQTIAGVCVKQKPNQYEARGNMQLAFEALAQDRVRLVNIGAEDVRSGNIKLILGLVWTLIRRYQIGSQSKLPPKSMMLSWCNAVLYPHYSVHNFSSDWNDGIALYGLIEYCRPGTCPHWYQMSTTDRIGNCTNGMNTAMELFGIPTVMRPEDLANPDVDELSGMTFLSYFMAEGSPGFQATLRWVQSRISPEPVQNFESDWNSGVVLSHLVTALGAQIQGWPTINSDWEIANHLAIDAARGQLDTEPVLSSKDLINPEVDHIGVMAHAAWLEAATKNKSEYISEDSDTEIEPANTIVELYEKPAVTLTIKRECKIDDVMTFDVDTGSSGPGSLAVYTTSPSDLHKDLTAHTASENIHQVEFVPTEKGDWQVYVVFDGISTADSPHLVRVYDPSLARINRDYGVANKGGFYTFEVDVSQVGLDDISCQVVHDGRSIDYEVTQLYDGKHQVSFATTEWGSFTVTVYVGATEIPGSPFDVVCKTLDGISASGYGLIEIKPRQEACFEIDSSTHPGGELHVRIKNPDGDDIECDVSSTDHAIHRVTYHPDIPGTYEVSVMYNGTHIPNSPFSVTTTKPQVYVDELNSVAYMGLKSTFKIDASEMQRGTLEIDSDLPVVSTEKVGQNVYVVTFEPRKLGRHDLVIKYKDEQVLGSPFEVDVQKYKGKFKKKR